jgi:hypothetical protein
VIIRCNLGHDHTVELPDDLITIAEAARLANRSMQTIMTHISTGALIGYPDEHHVSFLPNPRRKPKTLVSLAKILELYPEARPT